ncbi:gamma-glutamyltransferase [Saxibacter everestensis]|uniref:Gamma-glutamyltransferase n=1 Tax=Saxibacter everestensis TaxID=2909229 RepID=A0ABY8QUN0_9MICO|nr:gamma-glutamyltransferase [Brevibacteriaceae bacterium ZFBP1038]
MNHDRPGVIRGAVATPHSDATAAALDTLRGGGNAIDAALAAAAILTVVYPNQCSIGGDAIALIGDVDGSVTVINGSGRAASHLDVDVFRSARDAMPVTGAHTVTVPGVLSAWQSLASRWGSRPLSAALSRAAELADEGFPVAPGVARGLAHEANALAGDAGARDVFFRAGGVLTAGQELRLPRLAETLSRLASDGIGQFYGGEIGQRLVSTLRNMGSSLDVDDLIRHEVTIERPHAMTFRGDEYLSAGGNSQGTYFLQALGALDRVAERLGRVPDPLGADAPVVARILGAAAASRDAMLGDSTVAALDIDEVLGSARLDAIAAQALEGGAVPVNLDQAPIERRKGDTVAIVAADSDGRWVSLIQSAFHAFGSCVVDPATGILLHNRGASFVLTPGAAGELGPGRRPPHTLMPVLVRRAGELIGAHGTMGGRAQPQIHAHLALQLALGGDAASAVSASRWILGQLEAGPAAENDSISIACEGDAPSEVASRLAAAGFVVGTIPQHDDVAGHTQLVRKAGPGAFAAATDPRADGAAGTAEQDAG